MKNKQENHAKLFSNLGFIQHKFNKSDLLPIRKEVYKILNNFDEHKKQEINPQLVGNLEREYELIKCKEYVVDLLTPHIINYTETFDFLKTLNYNLIDSPIGLDKVWVNFQKKYEFNPLHVHSGIITFVIFLDIPYSIEDEIKKSPGTHSLKCLAGNFEFVYNNSLGAIAQHNIPADKTYEDVMLMFPAKMPHCAYPFYSSNKYRITVSGNFTIDNSKKY